MKSIRYYCDGHEYRYREHVPGIGEVHDNYGQMVATLERDGVSGEYFYLEVHGRHVASMHENDPDVATFEARAQLAIGQYAAAD